MLVHCTALHRTALHRTALYLGRRSYNSHKYTHQTGLDPACQLSCSAAEIRLSTSLNAFKREEALERGYCFVSSLLYGGWLVLAGELSWVRDILECGDGVWYVDY